MNITVLVNEDFLRVEYEVVKGSRKMWVGPGFAAYVKGSMSAGDFASVQHMVLTVADEARIPVSSIKLVKSDRSEKKPFKTNTKGMF